MLVRKSLLGVGALGVGASLVGSVLVPDLIFVWVISATGVFLGITGAACRTLTQTLAGPRVAGRRAGVQNFMGNLAGGVGPFLTGYLVGRTGHFYTAFITARHSRNQTLS